MFSINKKYILLSIVIFLNIMVLQSIFLPYKGAFISYLIFAFVAWRLENYSISHYLKLDLKNLKMYFFLFSITLILFGIYIDLKLYLNDDITEDFPYLIIRYFSFFVTIISAIISLWYLFKILYGKYFFIRNYKKITEEIKNL